MSAGKPWRSIVAKSPLLVIIGVCLVLVSGNGLADAQDRSVFWERWDVVIDNVDTAANAFDVREIYDLRFTGTFRFGSAVIPNDRLEAVDNVQVLEQGMPLVRECRQRPGTFCVERTSAETSITYYFMQPASNTTRRFEIAYRVRGALRVYEGGDQLWWSAMPDEHYGFAIGSATITVELPPGFAPREGIDPVVTYGAAGDVRVNGRFITAQAVRGVGPYESFEIRVQYPHDPSARAAAWQARFDQQRTYEEQTQPLINLGVIAGSLIVGLGGSLAIVLRYFGRGRDPEIGPVPEYLDEPPSDLSPAVAGTLIDERADVKDILSTILDLAQRGYLVIEEEQTPGFMGIGAVSKFNFKRTDRSLDDLRPFEKTIMSQIFGRERMERSLDSLRNRFYSIIPSVQNGLYDAAVEAGFFDRSPEAVRSTWSGLGIMALVLSAVFFFITMGMLEEVGPVLICAPLTLGFLGVTALALSSAMPAKTRRGAEEAAKWRAFRAYLRNLERYDDVESASQRFAAYLPYAVAFGLDRIWLQRFKQVPMALPPWYFPTYLGGPYRGGYRPGTPLSQIPAGRTSGLPGELARAGDGGLGDLSAGMARGLESMSNGLASMLDSASRVLTSRPQETGGSGSWSGGGRSFSGGGFSGGGSSGGGSRGFG